VRQQLLDSIATVAPASADLQNTESGIQLIVSDAEECFVILKRLVAEWMQLKNSAVSPLILGAKIGLHAGRRLSSSVERWKDMSSLGKAFRLAWAGNSDSIRMSYRMYNILERYLEADGIPVLGKQFDLGNDFIIDGHEVPLTAFMGSQQYRISLAPADDLMEYLALNPEYLRVIDPVVFERVVGRIFEDFGYEVELTKTTGDGGIDLVALRRTHTLGMDERYLIQCKRYQAANKVDVSAVRELLGVGAIQPHTGLLLATTSTFTAPAREYLSNPMAQWRLHLKDYSDLRTWLTSYAVRRR
jgi:hypothetical protein